MIKEAREKYGVKGAIKDAAVPKMLIPRVAVTPLVTREPVVLEEQAPPEEAPA